MAFDSVSMMFCLSLVLAINDDAFKRLTLRNDVKPDLTLYKTPTNTNTCIYAKMSALESFHCSLFGEKNEF